MWRKKLIFNMKNNKLNQLDVDIILFHRLIFSFKNYIYGKNTDLSPCSSPCPAYVSLIYSHTAVTAFTALLAGTWHSLIYEPPPEKEEQKTDNVFSFFVSTSCSRCDLHDWVTGLHQATNNECPNWCQPVLQVSQLNGLKLVSDTLNIWCGRIILASKFVLVYICWYILMCFTISCIGY